MFTQCLSPIYFCRNAESAGGTPIDNTTWPFNLPHINSSVTPSIIDARVEHEKQIKILGPLINAIAQEFDNGHTLDIISLVQQKAEQVIRLAKETEVTISGNNTTILHILNDSSVGSGSWSVVGYESVQAVKDFASGINLEMLKNL